MRVLGWAGVLLCAVLVLAAPAATARADGRVALVIGNADYGAAIGRLKNPVNDAKLIAGTLEGLGFKVDLVLDADQKTMKRAIKGFGARLRDAGTDTIGLFYYAGHGVQVGGVNYLIPVGAEITAESDAELEAVDANSVLGQMEFADNAVNLVFLDACRNNPLTRSFRSAERGLVRMDAPRGSFIGYSTAPGEVAADGEGANSPYALALAAELKKPGESVDTAHRNVRARVLAATENHQTPWDSSSLIGEVVLAARPNAAAGAAAAGSLGAGGISNEAVFWESIKDSVDPALFQAYLKKYPNGDFVDLAQARLAVLKPTQTAALTPEMQPGAATPTSTPDPMPPEVEALNATYVAKQTANVRSEPSISARALGKLIADDAVTVTGRVKGKPWLRVGMDGQTGYVSAALLAPVAPEELAAWKTLQGEPTAESAQSFLSRFRGGYFAEKAEVLLASLTPKPTPSPDAAGAAAAAIPPSAASGGVAITDWQSLKSGEVYHLEAALQDSRWRDRIVVDLTISTGADGRLAASAGESLDVRNKLTAVRAIALSQNQGKVDITIEGTNGGSFSITLNRMTRTQFVGRASWKMMDGQTLDGRAVLDLKS
jgi:uncharacterized caspase-like protein/uncharacterized protein YgiM (DUF1202 family)